MDMAYAHASHDTVASSARATSYYMSTSDQPAGFGSEPSTGSGMTVSVLGVTCVQARAWWRVSHSSALARSAPGGSDDDNNWN